MTEIPEDIREKAEDVFEYWMKTADTVIADLIARALLDERQSATAAERERCAKIAEHESEFAKSKFDELAKRSESGEKGLAYAMSAAMGLYAQADGIAGSIRGLSNDH